MKRNQIILSFCLIWVAFTDQFSAFTNSVPMDETDDLIQSISAGIVKVKDFSIQQNLVINAKKRELETVQTEIETLTTNLQSLEEQKRALLLQIIATKAETLAQEKAAIEQGMKAAQEKAEEAIKTATEIITLERKSIRVIDEIKTLNDQVQSAETARISLTAISQDRAKAAKLLEAIRNKNSSEANSLILSTVSLGGSATSVAVASVTADSSGAKITFRLGNLIHCISTQIQCSGQSATVSK